MELEQTIFNNWDNEITFFRGKKVNILTKEVNGKKKLESKPKKIWLFHYELK